MTKFFRIFFSAAVTLLILRYAYALYTLEHSTVRRQLGQRVVLRGVIESSAQRYTTSTFLIRLEGEGGFVDAQTKTHEDFFPGDRVRVAGVVERSKSSHPLHRFIIRSARIERDQSQASSRVARGFFAMRDFLKNRIERRIPYPIGTLGVSILLGDRSQLPFQVVEDFRRTGLSHVLALSGFNIIILITFIDQMLSYTCRRKARAVIALVIIILFVLMVGPSASIVRAAIMGSLTLIARLVSRPVQGLRSLLIAMYVMIMHEPLVIHDVGFQLSCGATAGLMLLSGKIEARLTRVPEQFGIRQNLASTLAAEVATLPIILFYFKSFSFIAPVINLIIVPLVPFFMLAVFLVLIGGKIFAAPAWILGKAMYLLIHAGAAVPFSFIQFGSS